MYTCVVLNINLYIKCGAFSLTHLDFNIMCVYITDITFILKIKILFNKTFQILSPMGWGIRQYYSGGSGIVKYRYIKSLCPHISPRLGGGGWGLQLTSA
jgi:hypothetical protein